MNTLATKMRVDKTLPKRALLCATCVSKDAPSGAYPCNCCWNPLGDMYKAAEVAHDPAKKMNTLTQEQLQKDVVKKAYEVGLSVSAGVKL